MLQDKLHVFCCPFFRTLKDGGSLFTPYKYILKNCFLEGLSNPLLVVLSLDPLYIPLESYYEWMVIHWHPDQDLIQQYVTNESHCMRAPFQEVLLNLWSKY